MLMKKTTMTEKQLKRLAREEYLDCRECGHYPEFITDGVELSTAEIKMYATDYNMTVTQFKQYKKYLEQLCFGD